MYKEVMSGDLSDFLINVIMECFQESRKKDILRIELYHRVWNILDFLGRCLMIELVIKSCLRDLVLSSFLIKYWISEEVVYLVGKHIGRVLDNDVWMRFI